MPTYRLKLEYCGTGFKGWAAQPGHRTVEQTVRGALAQVLSDPSSLAVAGRTDTGVHAWGQVVSFDSEIEADSDRLCRSLNGVLPRDVAVASAAVAADGFDARRHARSRTYCYRVLNRSWPSPFEQDRALWWPHELDDDALASCAGMLVGRHDFTAFTPTDTDHVRFEREVLVAEWRRAGELLEFWIEADTFMRHMVRVLVGTMLEVGAGSRAGRDFGRLLSGAPRPEAGATAEPRGLYLAAVSY